MRRRKSGRVAIALLALLLAILLYAVVAYLRGSGPYQRIGNRAEFASDACVEYGPTAHDRHVTVFVDPGHGGPDPGAEATAPDGKLLQEKRLTLAVALDMLPVLRKDGYHVAISRITDSPVARLRPAYISYRIYTLAGAHADGVARVDCANAAHAALLLSIHFNSYSDPSAGGVETAYDGVRSFAARNYRFAGLVQRSVLASLAAHDWSVPDRGVMADSALGTPALSSRGAAYGHLLELGPAQPGWLNHASQMPGALCEPLFITDPGEANVATSGVGQHALAGAFVRAINEYFGKRSSASS